jgi:hypothetical protein
MTALAYTIQRDEQGIVPCDSCQCEVPTSNFRRPPGSKREGQRPLCEFCSTTMTSRYTEYPAHDMEDRLRVEIWQAAACVYNMLAAPGSIEYKAVEAKPIDPADLL